MNWGYDALDEIILRYNDSWLKKTSVFKDNDGCWAIEWQCHDITAICFYPPDEEQDFGELTMHDVRSNSYIIVDSKLYNKKDVINKFEDTILLWLEKHNIYIKPKACL
jgi:hypothetical protein